MRLTRRGTWTMLAAVVFAAAFQSSTSAHHQWRKFHWGRTSNPVTVRLGDSVSSGWDAYLSAASSDWSHVLYGGYPDVLDAPVVTSDQACKEVLGRVEVCNGTYGQNGWLGIAQIWASGQHITQGLVKMNDTYFNTAKYNTPDWRQLVVCQEVGHTFGLDHQDERFSNANLNTCMDYTNDPSTNTEPNAHDYEQLSLMYSHLDTVNTAPAAPAFGNAQDFESPSEWGQLMKSTRGGRTQVFERTLGSGQVLVTFVIWA